MNMNNEAIYRVKVTPIHSSPQLSRLIINANEEKLALLRHLMVQHGLIKIKVLSTIFPPHSGKEKVVSDRKINDWYSKLHLLNSPEDKTLLNLKKGDLFRFEGKKTLLVYDGKLVKGEFHYHEYEDVNATKSTKNGLRKINIV